MENRSVFGMFVFSTEWCAECQITAAEARGDKNIVAGNTESAYCIEQCTRSLFSQDDPDNLEEKSK